jgi:hypothetical protein
VLKMKSLWAVRKCIWNILYVYIAPIIWYTRSYTINWSSVWDALVVSNMSLILYLKGLPVLITELPVSLFAVTPRQRPNLPLWPSEFCLSACSLMLGCKDLNYHNYNYCACELKVFKILSMNNLLHYTFHC